MTLSRYADLVLLKLHLTDDASREEAKKYIRQRYEMIWNAFLWRDSLVEVLVPSDDTGTRKVILPSLVDRVVNVIWDRLPMSVESMQLFYQVESWRVNQTQQENPVKFGIVAPSAIAGPANGEQLTLSSSDPEASFSVSIRGIRGNDSVEELISISGTDPVTTVGTYDSVLSLSKDTESFPLLVTLSPSGTVVLQLFAHETSKAFQVVNLITVPRDAKSISILGKRVIKPLINDADSPELTGIDNALLAGAIGDMLEGQRQYGKAQTKFTECSQIVEQMTRLERQQSASTVRVIPDIYDYDSYRSDDGIGDGFMWKGESV